MLGTGKTQDELEKLVNYYRQALDLAPSAIALVNHDGTIEFLNRRCVELFGYQPEDVPDMDKWWENAYPDPVYRAVVRKSWEGAIIDCITKGLKVKPQVWRPKCKDGSEKVIEFSYTPLDELGVCFFFDLTDRYRLQESLEEARSELEVKVRQRTEELTLELLERQRVEAALRLSEDKFFKVFMLSPYPMVLTRLSDGVIIEVNEASCSTFGHSRSETVGRPSSDLGVWIESKERDRILDEFSKVGFVAERDLDLRSRDGRLLQMQASCQCVEIDGEKVIISILKDVTRVKRLERQILRTRNLQSLGVLAGGLAHDFNNMLSAVVNNLYLAMSEPGVSESLGRRLREIESKCHEASGITRQLMTFAKGGAPVTQTVDLEGIIRDTVNFCMGGSTCRANFEFSEGLHAVNIDVPQFTQVINNLVLNALEASSLGSTVTVRAENTIMEPENPMGLPEGPFVSVSVIDQGKGIKPDHLERIFDPYFSTKTEGTGLGLAISHSIVTRHSGAIEVRPEQSGGTRFIVHLPAISSDAATGRQNCEQPARGHICEDPPLQGSALENPWQNERAHKLQTSGKSEAQPSHGADGNENILDGEFRSGKRILVVDDDPDVLETICDLIGMLGLDADPVSSGEAGVASYAAALKTRDPYAVVVMDLTIPGGMDGLAASREIWAIDPAARIIVTTGYSVHGVVAEFREHGFVGALRKPFRVNELKGILDDVAGG